MEALKFAVGEKMLDRALWIIREDGLYGKEFWDLDAENKRNGEMWGMHCPDLMGRCCKNENCRRMM
ncbi:MAG: hypothetical protein EHM20_13375 [Alphaproteobacteria bacterium]|nr:MAG: hypothetical protein EHM20_13375 [Alphaproteobacteria bacterium]